MTTASARRLYAMAGLLATLLSIPAAARAQIAMSGSTIDTIPGFPIVRGTDSAYDPVNRVYLQVSAQGPVTGRFVDETGAPLGGYIQITDGSTAYAAYPRVTYSPHVFGGAGGFLVTWHQNDGPLIGTPPVPSNVVHGRLVGYGAQPALGADTVLGGALYGTWWEAAPAAAYSVTSQQFLVTWQAYILGEVWAVRVGIDGLPVGAPFLVSDSYARDPGAAWNPNTNEFGISYSGADAISATVIFARVSTGGSVLRRTVLYRAGGSFITDIAFSSYTGNFVVAYAAPGPRTTEVSPAGDVVSNGVTASTVGAYDGLGIAFNPNSGSILMVGHYTSEVGGVELDGHGAKIGVEQVVSAGGSLNGSFYPRVAGNGLLKQWQVSYSRGFAAAASQMVVTTTNPPVPPVDTDGDGIPDGIDQCPTTPGVAPTGCPPPPDADGDGVPDSVDQCPFVPGVAPTGCPAVDSDGDGLLDNVDACPLVYAQSPNGCPAAGAPGGDFNGDGQQELIFVNQTTGEAIGWFMNGTNLVYTSGLWPADPGWNVVGTSDLTGDGLADLLWQHADGRVRLFRMMYQSKIGEQTTGLNVADPNWRVAGTGDINGDGQADIIWQHAITGNVFVWYMKTVGGQAAYNGGSWITYAGNAALIDWRLAGSGDFDNNGSRDMVWQAPDGRFLLWLMNGATVWQIVNLGAVAPTWQIRAVQNYAGDARVDLLFQNSASGKLFLWIQSGGGIAPYGFLNPDSVAPVWQLSGPR